MSLIKKGAKILIFIDTEFTDFIDCELISIALVSEDGLHEFYAERTDYPDAWCSDFVREAVLPLLGRIPGVACTRTELTARLWAWFATLPGNVQIACDSLHDRDLLYDALDTGLPGNLDRPIFDLRTLMDATVFHDSVCRYHEQPRQPWHHSLHDARAHRAGLLAWKQRSAKITATGTGYRADLGDSQHIEADEIRELAGKLHKAGVSVDSAHCADWREGDIAPGAGAAIALKVELRKLEGAK